MPEYREAFAHFNAASAIAGERADTVLTVAGLQQIFAQLGPEENITQEEVEHMVAEVDLDDTGTVDFPKFMKLMQSKGQKPTESVTEEDGTMRAVFAEVCGGGEEQVREAWLEDPPFSRACVHSLSDLCCSLIPCVIVAVWRGAAARADGEAGREDVGPGVRAAGAGGGGAVGGAGGAGAGAGAGAGMLLLPRLVLLLTPTPPPVGTPT